MESFQHKGVVFTEKYRFYGDMLYRLSMVYLNNSLPAGIAIYESDPNTIKDMEVDFFYRYSDEEKVEKADLIESIKD